MYIKLYYSEDHTPIGAAELYAEIADTEHKEICQNFLEGYNPSVLCDCLFNPERCKEEELTEDDFLKFQDEYIDEVIENEYMSTTIYIDDNDIIDERDVVR